MTRVPGALVRNAVAAWGDEGRRWVAALPGLIHDVARDRTLSVGEPYTLSFHWVAPVTDAAGRPAVLKLGPPGPGHLRDEVAALRAFDGRGAVRLLDEDAGRGVLLLERAEPGTLARDLLTGGARRRPLAARDADATAALITVVNRLHRAGATPLPQVETQREAFGQYLHRFGDHGPLPRELVERADRLFGELCADRTRTVVLHGDLHHDNVLRAEREPWLAIDPHGLVGDPAYEAAALLYNPDPDRRDPSLLALVPARIEQLADGLAQPVDRVTAWGFAVAMLSAVWDTEGQDEPGPPGRALDVARLLSRSAPVR
ncbi:aminoglycoside phosphotransferase family protein [Cryptosporangium arvum]|uniref:aminoglycoside phosphotransferase family protein n=1 Tax=Cryptosporangium arvum TaxID=80871 RepID=UPI0004B62E6C|nr:aminoglycoside phosphotransferase family protein [Cryptosporangium arvum]